MKLPQIYNIVKAAELCQKPMLPVAKNGEPGGPPS